MPRKVKWPPTLLHDPRNDQAYIRIYIRSRVYDTAYFGPWGKPETEVAYWAWVHENAPGQPPRPKKSDASVAELCNAHMAWADGYHAEQQYLRIVRALECVTLLYGTRPANDFDSHAFKAVRRWFIHYRYCRRCRKAEAECPCGTLARPGARLCRRYINSLMGCVRSCWKWGREEKLVTTAAYLELKETRDLPTGRSEAPDHEPVLDVDDALVEAVLPLLMPPVAAMVKVQRLTGMRPGEVVRMRPRDIHRAAATVQLGEQAVVVWSYIPEKYKGMGRGKYRVPAIGPRCQEILAPFLDRSGPDEYLFKPTEALEEWARRRKRSLNIGSRAKPRSHYDSHSYARAIARACRRAGVQPWHPHQLRHAVATMVDLASEEGLFNASVVLGHAGAAITRTYSHARFKHAARIAAKMG